MANDFIDYLNDELGNDVAKTDVVEAIGVEKQQDAQGASERAMSAVDALQPEVQQPSLIVRDAEGTVVGSGKQGDGDSLLKDRLGYAESKKGYAFDAWETYHANQDQSNPAWKKKMAKQRKALELIRPDLKGTITNDDVYKMGEYAAGVLGDYRSTSKSGSSLEATRDNIVKTGNYGRNIVQEDGALKHMNQRLLNADYYSQWNIDGRTEAESGSFDKEGKVVSTGELQNSLTARVKNTFATLDYGVNAVVAKTVNAVADTLAVEKFDPGERTLLNSIQKKRDTAATDAKNETDINAERNKAFSNIIADDSLSDKDRTKALRKAASTYQSTGKSEKADDNIKYSDAEERYLKDGYYDVGNGNNRQEYSKRNVEESLATLAKEDKTRREFLDSAGAESTKIGTNDKGENVKNFKVVDNGAGAGLEAINYANQSLVKKANQDTSKLDKATADAWEAGNYGTALVNVAKATGNRVWNHPAATLQTVAESVPEMALAIAAAPVAIAVTANASYRDQLVEYKKLHDGATPTEAEDRNLIALGMVKSVVDTYADKLLVSGKLTAIGKDVATSLNKAGVPMGQTAGIITTLLGGAASEGVQEPFTTFLEQVGARQGTNEKINYMELAVAASTGAAAGGTTSGILAATSIPGVAKEVAITGSKVALTGGVLAGKGVVAGAVAGYKALAAASKATGDITHYVKNLDKNRGSRELAPSSFAGMIGNAEAGSRGYNAYNTGRTGQGKKSESIVDMTVGELHRRQLLPRDSKDRIFAAGMFQITGSRVKNRDTFGAAIKALKLDPNAKMTPELQQRIFTDYLVKIKRPKLYNYIIGKSADAKTAQKELGKEWAGVAYDDKDRGYYDNDSAGNKASVPSKAVVAYLSQARAVYAQGIKKGMTPDAAYKAALFADSQGSLKGAKFNPNDANAAEDSTPALPEDKYTPITSVNLGQSPIDIGQSEDVLKTATNVPATDDAGDAKLLMEAALAKRKAVKAAKELDNKPINTTPPKDTTESDMDAELRGMVANDAREVQLEQEEEGLSEADASELAFLRTQARSGDAPKVDAVTGLKTVLDNKFDPETTEAYALNTVIRNNMKVKDTEIEGLSKLGASTQVLIKKLARYNTKLSSSDTKSFIEVQGEVLGTNTVNGKKGLGAHVGNITVAVAADAPVVAQRAIQDLTRFRDGLVAKQETISKGIDEGLKIIPYGKADASYEVRNVNQARNFVKGVLLPEIDLVNEGIELGTAVYKNRYEKETSLPVAPEFGEVLPTEDTTLEASNPLSAEVIKADAVTEPAPDVVSPAMQPETTAQSSKVKEATTSLNDIKATDPGSVTELDSAIADFNSEAEFNALQNGETDPSVINGYDDLFAGVQNENPNPAMQTVQKAAAKVLAKDGKTTTPNNISEVEQLSLLPATDAQAVFKPTPTKEPTKTSKAKPSPIAKVKAAVSKELDTAAAIPSNTKKAYTDLFNNTDKNTTKLGKVTVRALSKAGVKVTAKERDAIHTASLVEKAAVAAPLPKSTKSKEVAGNVPVQKPETETQDSLDDETPTVVPEPKVDVSKVLDMTFDNVVTKVKALSEAAGSALSNVAGGIGIKLKTTETQTIIDTGVVALADGMGTISKNPTSIISEFQDVSLADAGIAIKGRLTQPEVKAYVDQAPFRAALGVALDKILPTDWVKNKGVNAFILKPVATNQPMSLLMDNQGKLPTNVKEAMAASVLTWFKNNATSTAWNGKKEIGKYIGKDDDAVTSEELRTFAKLGVPINVAAMSIGRDVLTMLNLKAKQDGTVDPRYGDRLAMQIGDMSLAAMHNIVDAQGNPAGLLEYRHVEAEMFNLDTIDNQSGIIAENGEEVVMIRVPIVLNKNGYPARTEAGERIYPKMVEYVRSITSGVDVKSMMRKLYEYEGARSGAGFRPGTTAPTTHKGNHATLAPELAEASVKLSSAKLVPNTVHSIMSSMTETPEGVNYWLRAFGWTEPEGVSKGLLDGIEGANRTLEQGLEKFKEHAENADVRVMEVYNDIMALTGELEDNDTNLAMVDILPITRESEVKERNKSEANLKKNGTKLASKLEALETELAVIKEGGLYIPYAPWKSGRIGDTSSTISIQRIKQHRAAYSYADHVETVDVNNIEHTNAMVQAMTEGLDGLDMSEKLSTVSKDGTPTELTEWFRDNVMDAKGVVHNELLSEGIDAINDIKDGKAGSPEAIYNAVATMGEKGISMTVLATLATWQSALANGDPTYTSEMYTEVDGTTNGVIALLRQMATGFDPETRTGEHNQQMDLLNAGGYIGSHQEYEYAMDYLREGNNDVYQGVGVKAADAIGKVLTAKKIDPKEIGKVYNERKKYQEDHPEFERLTQEAVSLKRNLHSHILKNVIPMYTSLNKETGKVSLNSDGRNAAKPFVMTGAYMAGVLSLINGGFKASVETPIYKDLTNAEGEKGLEYINGLNQTIQESLAELYNRPDGYNFKPITMDTKLEKLDPIVLKALHNSYTLSTGNAMVTAYQNTMGSVLTNTKQLVKAFSVVGAISAEFINRAIEQAGKGRMPLTDPEQKALKTKLMAQGMYVGLQHAGSTGHSNAIVTEVIRKVGMTKKEGGRVETQGMPNVTQKDGKQIAPIRSIKVSKKGEGDAYPINNRNITLKKSELNPELGILPVVSANLTQDAMTQARTLVEAGESLGNVFDAFLIRALGGREVSKLTNAQWSRIMNEWSMVDSVKERLDYMMNMFKTLPPKVQARIESSVVNHARHPLEYDSFKEFQTNFNDVANKVNANRKRINKYEYKNGQYRTEGGEAVINPKPTGDVKGSSAQARASVSDYKEADKMPVTPSVMHILFTRAGLLSGIEDTKEHTAHLKNMMYKYVMPLVNNIEKFTVNMRSDTDKEQGGFIEKNQHVNLNINKGIRKFSTDMSGQEILIHEFIHPVWVKALGTSTATLKAVSNLHSLAKRKLTVENFIDTKALDKDAAREKAQLMYDHLFTGKDAIHEFATMGITNSVVMDVLNSIGTLSKGDNSKRFTDKLKGVFDKILRFFNSKIELSDSASIPQLLMDLAGEVEAVRSNTAANIWKKGLESSTIKKANKFIDDKVTPVISKVAEFDFIKGDSLSKKLLQLPKKLVNPHYRQAISDIYDEAAKNKGNFITSLVNEAKGSTALTKDYHTLLSRANEQVDTVSLRITAAVRTSVKQLLPDTIKKVELQSLTKGVMKTDLSALVGITSKDMQSLLSNDKELVKYITKTISKLKSPSKEWVVSQAKGLGTFMITNEVTVAGQLLNANNITAAIGAPKGVTVHKDDLATIDELKSLYAIQQLPKYDKETLSKYIDSKAVTYILGTQNNTAATKLESSFDNDTSQVQAGLVADVNDSGQYSEILANKGVPIPKGMEAVHDLGGGFSVYARKAGMLNPYQRGIVTVAGDVLEGVTVPLHKVGVQGKESMLPVVKGGKIIAYRKVIPASVKQELGVRNQVGDVVAKMASSHHRLSASKKYNEQLLDIASKDFMANYKEERGAFLAITTSSPNKQVRGFAEIMPKSFKDAANTKFGGVVYLRKDMLDLVIGYHKYSATDHLASKVDIPIPLHSIMKQSGELYQLAVSEMKRRAVLLTPAVVAANFASNIFVSSLFGMNPITTLADQREGTVAIRAYTKWQSEKASLEAAVRAGTAPDNAAQSILNLTGKMEASGINDLIEEGMFSTIIEDVDISDDSSSFIYKAADVVKRNFASTGGSISDKVPNSVKTVMAYASLAPSTELGSTIQLATAYADFVARYAMYKHLQRQGGMKKSEMLDTVRRIYVDYAPNTSRGLQYMNDMGMLMYTKFLIRIQRVIIEAMKTRPKATIAFEMAQQMLGNVPDIIDSSLLWGVSTGRVTTPPELVDALSEVPLWHFVKGLTP